MPLFFLHFSRYKTPRQNFRTTHSTSFPSKCQAFFYLFRTLLQQRDFDQTTNMSPDRLVDKLYPPPVTHPQRKTGTQIGTCLTTHPPKVLKAPTSLLTQGMLAITTIYFEVINKRSILELHRKTGTTGFWPHLLPPKLPSTSRSCPTGPIP